MRMHTVIACCLILGLAVGACRAVPAGARPPARGEQIVKVATVSPSSARVTIDGVPAGTSTGGTYWATLGCNADHLIVVEADGYLPAAQRVKSIPSPHRDGTPTLADLVVGEVLLEPNRLHPEAVYFQLIPDPDFGRVAAVPTQVPPAPAGVPGTAVASATPAVPDRSTQKAALVADLKLSRIELDEYHAQMRALYPEDYR